MQCDPRKDISSPGPQGSPSFLFDDLEVCCPIFYLLQIKMPPVPSNPKLYNKVKEEAKRRFNVWPSAYGSGWLVKEYKKRGGTYKASIKGGGLTEWFSQNKNKGWVDCKTASYKPCGRKSARTSLREYPACRPRPRDCQTQQAEKAIRAKKDNRRVRWKLKAGRNMSYCKCSGPNKTRGFTCAQHCLYKK